MSTETTVYLICEGEVYYDAWLPHAVFSSRDDARDYAADLVKAIDGQRWPNVYVYEIKLNTPGATLLTEQTQ